MQRPSSSFAPPGPGVWELESTHTVRPVSRWLAAVFPEAAMNGFKAGTERYGMLLDHLEMVVVNGFLYSCPRPVGAPKDAKGPPPKLIFKLLSKLHPEVRRRIAKAREVFTSKLWRKDVERWDAEVKPAIAKENRELQAVDPRTLDDAALAAHLERCTDVVRRAITTHHTFNPTAMLALGDFLVHVREWTGLGPSAVLPLFRGASRVSQGAMDELDAVRAALADQHHLLNEDVTVLMQRADAIGEAIRRYVDEAGIRVATGYDVADLTIGEMPDVIAENIRAAVQGHSTPMANDVAQREQQIRERVPAEHRSRFDEMLAEARHTYRIRDERAYLNDSWSTGIARRAILAAGERLAAKGRLHAAEHAVDLAPAELVSMLRGGDGPSADDVAAWAEWRNTKTIHDAPMHLGGTPGAPPPADWLPPDAARIARATEMVLIEMFAARAPQNDGKLHGHAASPGEATGVARLVIDPGDMGRVRKGDLLVTRATTPAYNALLPLIAAVVTDRGGTLSHAAVVAREYGIPAVVGTGNATQRIRDGMTIRVDGTKGTVEILA